MAETLRDLRDVQFRDPDGCAWCGHKGRLVPHHYPIAKQHGGKATIRICANCHDAAHAGIIINASEAKSEEQIQDIVDRETDKAIQQYFPLLYDKGIFVEPFDRKMILYPLWKAKL